MSFRVTHSPVCWSNTGWLIVTTFSAAVGVHARQPDDAHALLAFMASPAATDAKRRQGMEAA